MRRVERRLKARRSLRTSAQVSERADSLGFRTGNRGCAAPNGEIDFDNAREFAERASTVALEECGRGRAAVERLVQPDRGASGEGVLGA